MTIPTEPLPIPATVTRIAHGDWIEPAWVNEIGGYTFRLVGKLRDRFIKWLPPGAPESLAAEAERLKWARRYTLVPHVLECGANELGQWLVTAALPGETAMAPRWVADADTAARAVGAGLRALHDRLPVATCPFTWSVEDRIAAAAAEGKDVPRELFTAPEIDKLVVCHGDACIPNTLLAPSGSWIAHVDFGHLGVADRWADLAVATYSTQWDYGPGHEDALLEGYGIERDDTRIDYYRRLWDAT